MSAVSLSTSAGLTTSRDGQPITLTGTVVVVDERPNRAGSPWADVILLTGVHLVLVAVLPQLYADTADLLAVPSSPVTVTGLVDRHDPERPYVVAATVTATPGEATR